MDCGSKNLDYALSNDHAHSAAHHAALAQLLDPATVARLTALDTWPGSRCLVVGAGAGSIALWLADQVGPFGHVVATDLDTRHIPTHKRLRTVQHDLRTDDPLPCSDFDLICARLVLSHIPERETILRRLTSLLAPGGVILIEDWAPLRNPEEVVIAAPDPDAAELYGRYQDTIGTKIFDRAGLDRTWARRVHPLLLADGLVDVRTQVHTSYWTNGDAGCRMVAAILNQVRPRLREHLSDDDLDGVLDLLNNPGLIIHGHPMYSTSGRRRPADRA